MQTAARNPANARLMQDKILLEWVRFARLSEHVLTTVMELRRTALDTLLEASDLEGAQAVLESLEGRDTVRAARLREAQQKYTAAARFFERPGRREDALRNWRDALNWARALRPTEEPTQRVDFEWLLELERPMNRCPRGLKKRLRHHEQVRVDNLVRKAARVPDAPDTPDTTGTPDAPEPGEEGDAEG